MQSKVIEDQKTKTKRNEDQEKETKRIQTKAIIKHITDLEETGIIKVETVSWDKFGSEDEIRAINRAGFLFGKSFPFTILRTVSSEKYEMSGFACVFRTFCCIYFIVLFLIVKFAQHVLSKLNETNLAVNYECQFWWYEIYETIKKVDSSPKLYSAQSVFPKISLAALTISFSCLQLYFTCMITLLQGKLSVLVQP